MIQWDRATGLDGAIVYNNDMDDEDCHFMAATPDNTDPTFTEGWTDVRLVGYLPSNNWGSCGNTMKVRDGKLIIGNKVWRDVQHETISFASVS